jgi:hypothetical protein
MAAPATLPTTPPTTTGVGVLELEPFPPSDPAVLVAVLAVLPTVPPPTPPAPELVATVDEKLGE